MNKKLSYYLTGVLTGIIVGGITVFLIFGEQSPANNEYNFLKQQQEDTLKDLTKKNNTQTPPTSERKSEHKLSRADTTRETAGDTAKYKDSAFAKAKVTVVRDTILGSGDTTVSQTTPHSKTASGKNDITVMEDQLLYSQKYPVYDMAGNHKKEKTQKDQNLDSLLTDAEYNKSEIPDSIRIEFWKSPINYKGYKRINRRLIIFGFTSRDSLHIFHHNDKLFFRLKGKNFPLNTTDDFRSIWFDH